MVTLKEELKGKLNEKDLALVPKAFDVMGSKEKSIIVIEIPDEIKKHAKLIGETLMGKHRSVVAVYQKMSERITEFRVRNFKLLAGKDSPEVIHKENGCLIKFNPKKVYFSPREGNERIRVNSKAKKGERVLVMFSGCGPFAVNIAKHKPVKEVYAVELNPEGNKFCEDNVKLNKLSRKLFPIQGDVAKVVPKLGKFDRVVMPLPKGAYKFLNIAVKALAKDGVLHFYYWAPDHNLFGDAKELVKKVFDKNKRKFRVLRMKKVLPYGPHMWKIVLDVKGY